MKFVLLLIAVAVTATVRRGNAAKSTSSFPLLSFFNGTKFTGNHSIVISKDSIALWKKNVDNFLRTAIGLAKGYYMQSNPFAIGSFGNGEKSQLLQIFKNITHILSCNSDLDLSINENTPPKILPCDNRLYQWLKQFLDEDTLNYYGDYLDALFPKKKNNWVGANIKN